jgi:tRNA pseudouridine38-40 synthase
VTQRIALGIEYDGAAFHGWQRQSAPVLHTVQAAVEAALSQVADHPVSVVCAGRTDTGVHATGQVVHFDAQTDRGAKAWIRGTNSLLPPAARVLWAQAVSDDFHARFSALNRRYRYLIQESPVEPAILARQITHVREKLDAEHMHAAAQHLLGERDFSAFRAAGCQSKTPWREVQHLRVTRIGGYVVIDIQANAFLQHMVRNITGVLLEIGAGRKPPGWSAEILASRNRTLAAVTAKPYGLYLVQVQYPPQFGLPCSNPGPHFLHA